MNRLLFARGRGTPLPEDVIDPSIPATVDGGGSPQPPVATSRSPTPSIRPLSLAWYLRRYQYQYSSRQPFQDPKNNIFRDPFTNQNTPNLAARRVLAVRLSGSSAASLGGLNGAGGTASTSGIGQQKTPTTLREAIEVGDVLAVGAMVRAMTQEEAEVELVAQDR